MQTTIDSAPDSQLLCPKNMVVGDVYWIIGFHAIECKKGSKTWGKARLGFVCCFCSSAHSFVLQLPSDGLSRFRPCLRLILLLMCSSH